MFLKYSDENGLPQTFEFQGKPVVIGRGKDTDIQLFDTKLSREHYRIIKDEGEFLLKDLNSQNGTFLNDAPIDLATLKPGDKIRIGSIIMNFVDRLDGGTTVALSAVEQEMADGHGYNTILQGIIREVDDEDDQK